MRDPKTTREPPFTIVLDEEAAIEAHYAIFRALIDADSERSYREFSGRDAQFVLYSLPHDAGVIGLQRRLHDAIESNRLAEEVRAFDPQWRQVWQTIGVTAGAVGADGILLAGRPFVDLNDLSTDFLFTL